MVIQQAMAAGIPVVATRVGGVPDLIADGETGLLVEAGDVTSIAAKLNLLESDRALSERIGQGARNFALRRFRAAEVASRTRLVYESRLSAPR
jgi:glycosyltransferase involved in cell wall biosynthesis